MIEETNKVIPITFIRPPLPYIPYIDHKIANH